MVTLPSHTMTHSVNVIALLSPITLQSAGVLPLQHCKHGASSCMASASHALPSKSRAPCTPTREQHTPCVSTEACCKTLQFCSTRLGCTPCNAQQGHRICIAESEMQISFMGAALQTGRSQCRACERSTWRSRAPRDAHACCTHHTSSEPGRTKDTLLSRALIKSTLQRAWRRR